MQSSGGIRAASKAHEASGCASKLREARIEGARRRALPSKAPGSARGRETARNLGVEYVHAGGHEDHVHLLGRFDPSRAPSAVIGQIKQAATHWLHEENVREFKWQRGFSAFSVSRARVPVVVRYIQRQEEHHRKHTFREELERMLRAHGVRLEDAHLL